VKKSQFKFKTQLHYLIHVVDGEYVAHCLDADLVGTGKTRDEAIEEVNIAVRALAAFAIAARVFDIMSLCKPAPERYWEKFELAKQSGVQEVILNVCQELDPVLVKQRESSVNPLDPTLGNREFTYCVAELRAA
jgi:hypothetical protein